MLKLSLTIVLLYAPAAARAQVDATHYKSGDFPRTVSCSAISNGNQGLRRQAPGEVALRVYIEPQSVRSALELSKYENLSAVALKSKVDNPYVVCNETSLAEFDQDFLRNEQSSRYMSNYRVARAAVAAISGSGSRAPSSVAAATKVVDAGGRHHPELVATKCIHVEERKDSQVFTNNCKVTVGLTWCHETVNCPGNNLGKGQLGVELKLGEHYTNWGDAGSRLRFAACRRSTGYVEPKLFAGHEFRCLVR